MTVRLPRPLLALLFAAGAACTATVDGGELPAVDGDVTNPGDPPGARDPGRDGEPSDDDPLVPGDDDDPGADEPPLAPPDGPAGTCWGALAFDGACSRDHASAEWVLALFPGDASMAAMVTTSAVDDAAIVTFGPAGAASSARWSDALVAMLPGQAADGRFGAVRLVVPAAARDSMDVVHANAASARNDWRTRWQDEPTGIQAPGFASAYHEVDGQLLTWESSAVAGGVEVKHTVEIAGVQHEHTIEIGGAGPTSFRYRRLEGGAARESWSSDDGRLWHPDDGGADETLDEPGEQNAWSIPLPRALETEGVTFEARQASWARSLGWLEGDFAGLAAPLVGGFATIGDLWVDVETATVQAFTLVFWDGEALHEWDATGGAIVPNEEFPASYQSDRGGARVEVRSEAGQAFASVEAIAEPSQVRVVVKDLLPVGEESIAAAWRWEVVFEAQGALPTGEVAAQRTDATGCQRQLSYDFGATWAVEACR